jgi:hypothetical protein
MNKRIKELALDAGLLNYPEKAWKHFDPCGLLAKLIEVGK